MRRRAGILALVVLSACAVKDSGSGDSTAGATMDSVSPAPTVSPDTLPPAAPFDTLKGAPGSKKPAAKQPARDSIIGRDSAFGPIGTIDASGKVTPIKKK